MNRRTFLTAAGALSAGALSAAALGELGASAAEPPAEPPAKPPGKLPARPVAKKSGGRTLRRASKPTLTPCVLNHGETLAFTLRDGRTWELTVLETSAEVTERNYRAYKYRSEGDISAYAFDCLMRINGRETRIRREVGTQQSFYEPYEQDGVRVWLDAVGCIAAERGGFLVEKDWRGGAISMPSHHARLVVHEAGLPICPEPLAMWYPNEAGRIDIRDCYNGEDVFMGPYAGAQAHSGLDVNMKAGTVLTAPLNFDDHYLFNATAAGFNNNRWRGVRRWPDGAEWHLQSHHLIRMLVPERTPLKRGTPYATTAGVHIGAHEHTHFVFRVIEQGGDYLLDPWILFWEMFRQQKAARANTETAQELAP